MANDIGISLNTHLLAQSGVTTLCAQRGHPDVLPKNCLLPAYTYQIISDIPSHHMGGVSGLRQARVQFDSYADTRRVATQLDEAILAELDMESGSLGTPATPVRTIQAQDRIDGEDQPIDGSDNWRQVATRDYLVWYIP